MRGGEIQRKKDSGMALIRFGGGHPWPPKGRHWGLPLQERPQSHAIEPQLHGGVPTGLA